MKKRAGSFFKSVMSKGKNLFKNKEDEETKVGGGDQDHLYDSDEDTDIIEVGGNRNSAGAPLSMPGNSLIIQSSSLHHNSPNAHPSEGTRRSSGQATVSSTKLLIEFAGNTLQAADHLIHGGGGLTNGGGGHSDGKKSSASKNEFTQISNTLNREQSCYKSSFKNGNTLDEAISWCDGVQNWYFTDLD